MASVEKWKRLVFRQFPAFLFFVLLGLMILFLIINDSRKENYVVKETKKNNDALNITILVVVTAETKPEKYKRALDSLTCYSKIHGYNFVMVVDSDYAKECGHLKDKFFRRHCVVAQFLSSCDYLLFLDADMGVVNPERRIEEFIDERFDVTFYDRFYNAEITAGAYLLKNSAYALDFIKGFADFEMQLPKSFHGTDNGALHAYVASKIFPDRTDEYKICLDAWKIAGSWGDLFTFESCIRSIIGVHETFQNIRIMKKGSGWARDNWLTNSMWNPEMDFMIHGWKQPELVNYKNSDLPLKAKVSARNRWFDPIVGQFNLDQCVPGNFTWSYDPNLIGSVSDLKKVMANFKKEVQRDNFKFLANLTRIVQ